MHRHNAQLFGNTYTNMSMGVRRYLSDSQYLFVGALVKLVNIMSARMSQETFENIGGYTVEFQRSLLSQIFGYPIEYLATNEKTELFSVENR